MAETFRLGMGQMLVEGGAVEANLARGEEMVRRAARRGCRLVVLPECLDTGWMHPSAADAARPIPGPSADPLCRAAAREGVHVVAGLTERDGEAIYNTAVLLSPEGRLLHKHRKINVLRDAQGLYETGDRLGVVRTPLGVFGLNICADNFPDSLALGHALARMGAQVVLSPCAWAVDADHDNAVQPYGALWRGSYGELARLYDLWVVGVSNVGWITGGPWCGRKCIGCSLAVAPGGRVAAQGPYGEAAEDLVVVEVRLVARTLRGTDWAPHLKQKGYEGP